MKLQFKHPQDRPYLVWEKSIETHPFFQKLEENLSELSSAKFATIFFFAWIRSCLGLQALSAFFPVCTLLPVLHSQFTSRLVRQTKTVSPCLPNNYQETPHPGYSRAALTP